MESTERVWRERGLREAVLAGDEIAWRRWYEESCEPLYAYLLWRCGGLRDHADELAQEVWLLAVRKLPHHGQPRGRVPVLLAVDVALRLAEVWLGQVRRARFGQLPGGENLGISAGQHAPRRSMGEEPAAGIGQRRFRQPQ